MPLLQLERPITVIKKYVLGMLKCDECQSGLQIRTEIKDALQDRANNDKSSWIVDCVKEYKKLNASNLTCHRVWNKIRLLG